MANYLIAYFVVGLLVSLYLVKTHRGSEKEKGEAKKILWISVILPEVGLFIIIFWPLYILIRLAHIIQEKHKLNKINLDAFAHVASSKLHKKYIDGGTAREYLTASDLIEALLSSMRRIILHTDYKNKDRILNLYVYCMKQIDSAPDDLYNSEQWNNIVTSVRNYLIHIEKYSIEDWENKENL